ncbi:MAG TPA: hypothetical protein V6D17_21750 [Candidatus Obscuribacterales bacterium]
MKPRAFFIRLAGLPILATVASLVGAVTSSWWAAALMGFLGAIVFTFVSERIVRGLLFGKIGAGPLAWYFVHLLEETAAIALIAVIFSFLFGASIGGTLAFSIMAFVIWVFLCKEMLGNIGALLPMWLATRRLR